MVVESAPSAGKKGKSEHSQQNGKKLQLEFFSVLMGSYLKSFAKTSKNPCLQEYRFALSLYRTRILQTVRDLEEAETSLQDTHDLLKELVERSDSKMPKIDDDLNSQCAQMYHYVAA